LKRFGRQPRPTRRVETRGWDNFFNEEDTQDSSQGPQEIPLAEAGIAVRMVNILEQNSIFTTTDFAKKTREELIALKNMGESSLDECIKTLEVAGYTVKHLKKKKRRARTRRTRSKSVKKKT
jgi:DNA-directed RNA polymerase alpha subunit